ncbi:alpha-L-fucosidase-like [Haliotis rufescens]|uniref:alpha-L-fucosidase-like n=1 Tax=Haliotis rufescens TaxID=6454 RepID=UPI00201E9B5D|nr:alpha-L-fucosidase-like [Haliotis rufescens]
MAIISAVAGLLCLFTVFTLGECRYEPNWQSIDSRPLPSWYDESKIGIFIHWGVFSVPSYVDEWFWYYWKGPTPVKSVVKFMEDNYRPGFTYADFAPHFTAEFFSPYRWADIFQASGARYVVFVSKHHEGFTNWPSKASFNWNSMDVGPRRDIVGELTNAIRNSTDLRMGVYHSLFEWFNPLFNADKANKFKTQDFVTHKTGPELYELVNKYKPDIIWSDGCPANSSYWNSTQFLAWLYNDSPVKDTVVTNDRWGSDTGCKHGGFFTCSDRYNPGFLQKHKWENCLTLDKKSWGYRREAVLADYMTMKELTKTLAETISCGGNMLINVGPTHDGRIVPVFEERLRQLGAWLKVNGEAVYSSKPWSHQNDTVTPNVWYTMKKSTSAPFQTSIYAFVLDWPKGSILGLDAPRVTKQTNVTLLGYPKPLTYMPNPTGSGVMIDIPEIGFNEMPCDYAWIFKMTNLAN